MRTVNVQRCAATCWPHAGVKWMVHHIAELEARNSQMVFDLAAAREESVRARQAAEATKAALAAKPVGVG